MKLTYAIGVCTEARELLSLLNFLIKVKDAEDDINILVDSGKVTTDVEKVLKQFKPMVTVVYREFDKNFSEHRNFHITKCSGDYIFMIDADEIPQESMIRSIKQYIFQTKSDLVYIPRMNTCPGFTDAWLKSHNFQANECGWINWPDYQGRIFKNDSSLRWGNKLHERIEGSKKTTAMDPHPKNALFHIKSVETQDKQGLFYDSLA
jgi:hypothetical protein